MPAHMIPWLILLAQLAKEISSTVSLPEAQAAALKSPFRADLAQVTLAGEMLTLFATSLSPLSHFGAALTHLPLFTALHARVHLLGAIPTGASAQRVKRNGHLKKTKSVLVCSADTPMPPLAQHSLSAPSSPHPSYNSLYAGHRFMHTRGNKYPRTPKSHTATSPTTGFPNRAQLQNGKQHGKVRPLSTYSSTQTVPFNYAAEHA